MVNSKCVYADICPVDTKESTVWKALGFGAWGNGTWQRACCSQGAPGVYPGKNKQLSVPGTERGKWDRKLGKITWRPIVGSLPFQAQGNKYTSISRVLFSLFPIFYDPNSFPNEEMSPASTKQ